MKYPHSSLRYFSLLLLKDIMLRSWAPTGFFQKGDSQLSGKEGNLLRVTFKQFKINFTNRSRLFRTKEYIFSLILIFGTYI
jgi:hypothetical protein